MTAKEIARGNLFLQLNKELPNEKFEETYQVPEWCLKSMKEFALLIAREAVEEEREVWPNEYFAMRAVLANIEEKLTEES